MLLKILNISKNASNENSAELNFVQETPWTYISISNRCGAGEIQKFGMFDKLHCIGWRKFPHFTPERRQKYRLYRKMLPTKVAQNSISYKKLPGRISPSLPGVELAGSKNFACLTYYNALRGESPFT